MEGLLVSKMDLQALNLSGTYCHKTGIRPPSCAKPHYFCVCGNLTGLNPINGYHSAMGIYYHVLK